MSHAQKPPVSSLQFVCSQHSACIHVGRQSAGQFLEYSLSVDSIPINHVPYPGHVIVDVRVDAESVARKAATAAGYTLDVPAIILRALASQWSTAVALRTPLRHYTRISQTNSATHCSFEKH